MKIVHSLQAILLLLIITGCMNQEKPVQSLEATPTTIKQHHEVPADRPKAEQNSKINLFDDVSKYDGTAKKDIEIAGQTVMSKFVNHDFLPVGLYIPEYITEKKFHDGNEFEGPNHTLIGFFEPDQLNLNDLVIRKENAVYQQYIGSHVYDGKEQVKILYEDFFEFKVEGKEIMIRLTYKDEDRDELFPKLLDILKNMKYIE